MCCLAAAVVGGRYCKVTARLPDSFRLYTLGIEFYDWYVQFVHCTDYMTVTMPFTKLDGVAGKWDAVLSQ